MGCYITPWVTPSQLLISKSVNNWEGAVPRYQERVKGFGEYLQHSSACSSHQLCLVDVVML